MCNLKKKFPLKYFLIRVLHRLAGLLLRVSAGNIDEAERTI